MTYNDKGFSINWNDDDKIIVLQTPDDRKRFLKSKIAQEFKYFLESTGVGGGKTWHWSQISADEILTVDEEEEEKPKFIFVLKQKYQYNIEFLNTLFTPFITRHGGLVKDAIAKNIDGSPVLRNVKPGEIPDIESNCIRFQEIIKAKAANIETDLCGINCKMYQQCTRGVGDGYGALFQIGSSAASAKLKMTPTTVTPSMIQNDNTLLVIDEVADIFQPVMNYKFTIQDVQKTRENMVQLLSESIFEDFSSFDPEIDIEDDEDFDETCVTGNPFGDGNLGSVAPCMTEAERMLEFLRRVEEFMRGCNGLYGKGTHDFMEAFEDFKNDALTIRDRFFYYYAHIGTLLSSKRTNAHDIDFSDKFWSEALLESISKLQIAGMRFTKKYIDIVTMDVNKTLAMQKCSAVVLLDATSCSEEMQLMYGLPHLIEYRVDADLYEKVKNGENINTAHYNNVTIVHLRGFKNVTNNSSQDHVDKMNLIKARLKEYYGKKVGFIVGKKYAEDGDLRHFIEGRGSNAFQNKKVLGILSVPRINLGACLSLYTTFVNESVSEKDKAFMEYFRYKAESEIMQEIGRLRYNRRAKEKNLLVFITGIEDVSFLEKRGFPVLRCGVDKFINDHTRICTELDNRK